MNKLYRFRFELLLFLLVIFLRIPSYFEPHWYVDEEIYLTIGKVLRHGGRLYADIIDHKPPLLYWLAASLETLLNFKLFLSVALGLGAVGLSLLSKRLQFPFWGRIVTLTTFVILTTLPTFEGNVFNAELVFIALTIWGMNFLWIDQSAPQTKLYLVLGGASFGTAILFKIPTVFDALAAVIAVLVLWKNVKTWIWFLVGLTAPVLVVLAILMIQGNLQDFWIYAISYNFTYIDDWSTVQQSPLIHFLAPWPVRVGIIGCLAFVVWYVLKNKMSLATKLILTWFWLSVLGALLSLRPYAHYFLQVFPALSLLAGLLIARKTSWWARGLIGASILSAWLLVRYLPVEPYRTRAYYTQFFSYMSGALSWKKLHISKNPAGSLES